MRAKKRGDFCGGECGAGFVGDDIHRVEVGGIKWFAGRGAVDAMPDKCANGHEDDGQCFELLEEQCAQGQGE